jgi:hypothetical protein
MDWRYAMSSLIPFPESFSGLSLREERQLDREKARIHANSSLMAARQVAKIEAITEITEEALFRASEVASITGMLVQRTPQAETALNHIASAGITAMADVVVRSGRSCKCR